MAQTDILKHPSAREARSGFIPYCKHTVEAEEIAAIVEAPNSDWLTTGPRVVQFEREFAEYIGCRHAIAVNSCTSALHLALRALEIKPGDEVITTPLTFCATCEVIEYENARPVFVDIDLSNFNIDPIQIEEKITNQTRAIIPVHYGGIPCDLTSINCIAKKCGLHVIEDAAHAVGSIYKGQKIGGSGNLTAFSFYPTKNMTTGEGGIIATNDLELADSLKILSLHGISKDAWRRYSNQGHWFYEIQKVGFKYNLTDLQASLGIQQLKKLDRFNQKREELAKIYFDELSMIPEIQMPEWYGEYFNQLQYDGFRNSWHLFVILINPARLKIGRNRFIEELKLRGVGTSVHFIPLHLQPYYSRKYHYRRGNFPNTELIYDRILSLPLYPRLTLEQINHIIGAIREIVVEFRL